MSDKQPSTALATNPAGVTERAALMLLNEEQVAVKIDDNGFLTRIKQTVRLTYGVELYSAAKPGSENNQTKVAIFQPGYMKLVSAMGGTLTCPPAMRDPVTGDWRANPLIEKYDDGLVKTITVTAICSVRNPQTGEDVTSIQTVVFDAEHVLRQKLLNVSTERQDVVQILSKQDIEEMRVEDGKPLRGWSVYPLSPPFTYIVANNRAHDVRDAQRDHNNLVATARQRACSKAERLAADHNPVVRKTWLYGALKYPRDAEGNACGPRYAEVPVVTWVEHREQSAMRAWLDRLARMEDGLGQVIVGEPVRDDGDDVVDSDEFDPDGRKGEGEAEATPALEQRDPIPSPALPPKEPVAEKEKVLVTPVAEPAPAVQAPPTPAAMTPAKQTILGRIVRLENGVPPDEIPAIRKQCGIGDALGQHDEETLRTYQRELAKAAALFGGAS